MAQVINIAEAPGARARRGWYSPHDLSPTLQPHRTEVGGQPSVTRESVYRAILLLDLAAQQTRVLLRNITDTSRKSNFEAQIKAIEQSLQRARDLALRL